MVGPQRRRQLVTPWEAMRFWELWPGRTDDKLVAFGLVAAYLFDMSLAQIKEAVTELSPAELAELASFVCEKDSGAWDSQIDADFAEDGRLRQVLEEVRADVRAGRLEELP